MRVLYHHRTQGRQVEGVHIRGIVGGLRQLGHSVDVISFPGADPEQNIAKDTQKPGIGFRMLQGAARNVPEFMFEALELAYNFLTLWRVGSYMRGNSVDLIYERYSLFLFATVWLARRNGVKIILEINDSALVQRVRPLSFQSLARRIERWTFRNASGLVFISKSFLSKAEQEYGELNNYVVSPNAVDSKHFDPGKFDKNAAKARLKLDGQVVCGYVGAFVEWHGIHWFATEVAESLRKAPNLSLLLVGDGKMFDDVRLTAEQKGVLSQVILPGRVEHAEVADYIAAMDFAVLPDSNDYGSPMKLFEFMSMGVAVVAPDYGPIREVIEDDVSGWLFPASDRLACVRQVISVYKDGSSVSVGKAARKHVIEHHQWRNNAQQIVELAGKSEELENV